MVRVREYEGVDLGLLDDTDTVMSKFDAIGKDGRHATVGARGWMRMKVQTMGPRIPIEMRHFHASERRRARRPRSA